MPSALPLALLVALSGVARADTIDSPTPRRGTLRGSAHRTGELTATLGFSAHLYEASRDGFVRIELTTANRPDRPRDNGGRAWRPFLRAIGARGAGWSTNGQPGAATGHAALLLRAHAGETFTVIATLGQNVEKGRPAALATYALTITELRGELP